MRRLLLFFMAAGLAACSDSLQPLAPESDTSELALTASSDGIIPGHYIVTVDDAADPAAVAASYGITPRYIYQHLLTGFAAEIPSLALESLRLDTRVRLIEADQVMRIDRDTVYQSTVGGSWGLDRIDQRELPLDNTYRYTYTGAGVRAYIIDTGIRYDHVEFQKADGTSRASFGVDVMPDAQTQRGDDCHGHGTHVAGTVGGRTYGVAKDVQLISVRVLSCAGSGTVSGIIAGIDWIAENARLPAVASMSIGSGIPSRSEAYEDAVRNLFDSGVLLMMSAGNGWAAAGVGTGIGYDSCLRSPSAIQVGITVGNANRFDEKATSSNYGDCVDIFAPGSSIVSGWATSPTATRTASGTSMATPHVTGVAALFLQQARGATPQQVKDGILSQATKGVVALSLSKNNDMLYSLVEALRELRGSRPKNESPCTPKRQREGQC